MNSANNTNRRLNVSEDFQSDRLHQLMLQVDQLKQLIAQVKHTQHTSAYKNSAEAKLLRRLINNLSIACSGYNDTLNKVITSLKTAFDQQTDVSALLPYITVLEHVLQQNSGVMEKQINRLDESINNSGETLRRIPGLPAQLKRDLNNLLTFPSAKNKGQVDQATKLLSIYERAIKIITSNSAHSLQHDLPINKGLLEKLADELQNLIYELDFKGESGDRLTDIRIKLLKGVGTDALIDLTLQVLKIIIEGTQFERKSSEQFLTQVNTSLSSIVESSASNLEQSESNAKQRQQMTGELLDTANKSQALLSDSDDIYEVKAALKPLLEQITELTERLAHHEKRDALNLERVSHNNQQLEGLFEFTEDHRRRFEDQAKRLLMDPLTQLYNRTAFIDRLELEYRKWIRSQNTLKAILIDIDQFKAINDNFGYAAGDKALKIIARTISKEVGKSDIVARFSGEEFIVLLPDADDKACETLVQTLQKKINALPFKFKERHIEISVSVAVTDFIDSDTPEQILDRLNLCLNQAKLTGKNQIVFG